MALEVLHQQAATHENEQFRRVVKIIDAVFKKHGYNGILVGNPFNENYQRFRADAILLFDHGVVIIDFKNYSGRLIVPNSDDEFKSSTWYAENTLDHQAIEVKAGAHFLNPFLQLVSYRNAFREIVENNLILRQKINTSRVCIVNIFSGPLELTNKVPGKYPYYKIVQESEIGSLLYDLNNDNAFDEDIANVIKRIFPSSEYVQDYLLNVDVIDKQSIIVGEMAKSTIDAFMQSDGNDMLVLTSMNSVDRDNWAKYIFSIADNYNIPEVRGLCHSNRICSRLRYRGIEAISLYSFIYGGSETSENEETDDVTLQIIPICSDVWLDERALLVVYDAHLVSRSLSQTDLLRFGSGRLLEDFIIFANPASKRKIIFIGDPYMLSFGSSDDSAVNVRNLHDICGERVIHYYHQAVPDYYESCKESLKCSLAKSLDVQLFNKLSYPFNDGTVVEIEKDEIVEEMKKWFSDPFDQEPKQSILLFKKNDCHKVNIWVKVNCLNNGNNLASGDLLIANGNIYIPDETGFGNPKRVFNGMYFTVINILDSCSELISIKGYSTPVLLSFTKVSVKCLSLSGQSAEIWVFDNYLNCADELSKEEQIAMNIFVNRCISKYKKLYPFTESEFYRQMISDREYQTFSDSEKGVIETIIQNRLIPKEDRISVNTTKKVRSLLKHYYDKYESGIQRYVRESDPLVNVLYAKYGWAITVHKAIGTEFNKVILKGYRTENDGISNESYFRWLYSGISVSTGVFYITQPQYVHPFMNCAVVESVSNTSQSKRLLVYNEYTLPSRFAEIFNHNNINTAAAICELSKILESKEYILHKVKKCDDYLTKAMFLVPQNGDLIINFYNKGEKDSYGISVIKMEHNEFVDINFINQSIETVFSQNKTYNTHLVCPDYIIEVINLFIEQIKKRGLDINIVSCKDYQINCNIASDCDNAMVRLWYGTSLVNHSKGFVNSIEVFDNAVIADEVRQAISLIK